MTVSVGRNSFSWPIRVYYQHTDAGGMVFHANYFSFMECSRTELLQSQGFDLGELARRDRVLFVVHSAQIAYHKPALLNDALRAAALEPSDLTVRVGTPPVMRQAAPGRFMDRAT